MNSKTPFKFLYPVITLIFILSFLSLKAQDTIPLSPAIPLENLDININPETPDTLDTKNLISIQGKLKMKGLPLSPSIKIFMQEDSLIDISIRVPLMGEAGRMTVTPDTVLLVNKMNKTFVKEGITDFLRYYPGGISDLQDLLLARFFLPGFNVEEADLQELVDIYYEGDQYNIIPKGDAVIPGVDYGFVVDEFFNPQLLVVLPESRPDIQILATYQYSDNNNNNNTNNNNNINNTNNSPYILQISYQEGAKIFDIFFDLKAPEYTEDFPKPVSIDKKFRQLSLSDFLRSF